MNKKMNLYQQYLAHEQRSKSVSAAGVAFVLFGAMALIMVAYGVSLMFQQSLLKGEIASLSSYINAPANVEQYEAANAIAIENSNLATFKDSLGDINDVLDTKQGHDSQVLTELLIATPAGLRIDDLTITESVVVIQYSSKREVASSEYIENLKNSGLVKEVNYDGYQYDAGSERYTGSATIILRGNY